jgi:hypothetical protein
MVFVVRRDLGWHKQKLAVMTAHAALALFKKVYKSRNPALMQWVRARADVCESAGARTMGAVQFEAVLSWSQACRLPWQQQQQQQQHQLRGTLWYCHRTQPCTHSQQQQAAATGSSNRQQQHHALCSTMHDSSGRNNGILCSV